VGFRRTDRQTHGRIREREEREERFAMERWTSESQSGRPGFCVGHLCGSSTQRDHNWRETRGVKVSNKALANSRLGGTRSGRDVQDEVNDALREDEPARDAAQGRDRLVLERKVADDPHERDTATQRVDEKSAQRNS
jgi:hypothetical protein